MYEYYTYRYSSRLRLHARARARVTRAAWAASHPGWAQPPPSHLHGGFGYPFSAHAAPSPLSSSGLDHLLVDPGAAEPTDASLGLFEAVDLKRVQHDGHRVIAVLPVEEGGAEAELRALNHASCGMVVTSTTSGVIICSITS